VSGLRAGWIGAFAVGMTFAVMEPARGGGAPGEVVEGALIGPGVECPQFQLAEGEVISLTGAFPDSEGTYQLTGRWARLSFCMQGRTFDVLSFARIDVTGD
jgi:hypothetical protein